MAISDSIANRVFFMFQSPSRGGRLCGVDSRLSMFPPLRFSPLHEGDASVAVVEVQPTRSIPVFQSPSRGGRLCGPAVPLCRLCHHTVSVPFTRGTPLWQFTSTRRLRRLLVSVPFTRGTPLWLAASFEEHGQIQRFSPLHEGDASVAVPKLPETTAVIEFQSPSRGGRLCGTPGSCTGHAACNSFSPLHEGDASVALITASLMLSGIRVSVPFTRGTPLWRGGPT